MPIIGENIERVSEPNGEEKRLKRAKPNPTMPGTTPITPETVDPKVWAEVRNKLNTLRPARYRKKTIK